MEKASEGKERKSMKSTGIPYGAVRYKCPKCGSKNFRTWVEGGAVTQLTCAKCGRPVFDMPKREYGALTGEKAPSEQPQPPVENTPENASESKTKPLPEA